MCVSEYVCQIGSFVKILLTEFLRKAYKITTKSIQFSFTQFSGYFFSEQDCSRKINLNIKPSEAIIRHLTLSGEPPLNDQWTLPT